MPAVCLLDYAEYFRDKRPWRSHRIIDPSWPEVEQAIRRMDNFCFPLVVLGNLEAVADESLFNIVGGAGQYALFHQMGAWQYSDPNGSDAEVHLWESDQGYYGKKRNILTDIERVLRIARQYYESGSYDSLDAVT